MSVAPLANFGRSLFRRRWIAGAIAIALLAISLALAWQRERADSIEQARQVVAQADILAGSVAGALAFDDLDTTREYLDALKINEEIQAAAIYGADGALIAGFAREGDPLPPTVQDQDPVFADSQLAVVQPVRQENLFLGFVYLRTAVEPLFARISRYVAIGAVLVMAALLIAILGASNAAAAAANRQLQEQIEGRERAESALRQSQKMEALGQLTGGVAHDFNNLLMAASAGLELMGRAKTEEKKAQLEAGIRDALDRGGRLTQQLLDFSRRTPAQTETIDVARRLGALSDLLSRSLGETVDVRFAIAPDLWPIEADAAQFDVAILNLAVNARDAMPQGGQIRIAADNRGGALEGADAVEVRVEDEGAGMSAEARERAFEPFFTTKEKGRGTGLGLSQVYGFARASGGAASIASEPGEGTTITMLFPRSHAAPRHGRARALAPDADSLAGLRVLLVEDDPAVGELVGAMLEEFGTEVVHAASAAEGLDTFDAAEVDAVLSDMVMPGGMNGLDLARSLRRRREDLPVLLMTGFSDAADTAVAEGFRVLRKPFTMEALGTSLRRASEHGAGGSA